MGSRSKLCLSDSLGRGEPLGQRLESLNGQGLSSDSLDGISRQLLGSLGNLPENDPVLRDMLASMASAPPTLGDIPEGKHSSIQRASPCIMGAIKASQLCSRARCNPLALRVPWQLLSSWALLPPPHSDNVSNALTGAECFITAGL